MTQTITRDKQICRKRRAFPLERAQGTLVRCGRMYTKREVEIDNKIVSSSFPNPAAELECVTLPG